ncbi:MAG: hypothetical protein NTX50_30725 [Candidatus Sumerlaeota bacterium]|nr:hypothetical protein [Candidatus Sumerlaeota bacterium]
MIPVARQDPPDMFDFDGKVRKPGIRWLREHKISRNQPLPPQAPKHWRKCEKALWKAYGGVCAYLCIYFEWALGAHSVDHFIAQSKSAGLAYEWSNYRLSCLGANRRKNRFDDILDPFRIAPETFVLNLACGNISPNPVLPAALKKKAEDTIRRLKLDDPENNNMRAEHFGNCCALDSSGNPIWSPEYLKMKSPFVWYEARRQGLL